MRFYEEHLPDMPIPEEATVWRQMIVTDDGNVWLRRATASGMDGSDTTEAATVWDVFDPDGVLGGTVRVSSNVTPLQVAGRSVLALVRDEFGRGRVAIHDVRWRIRQAGLEDRPRSP